MKKKNKTSLEMILIIVIGLGLLLNLHQIRKAQSDLQIQQKEIHKAFFPGKYYDVSAFEKIDVDKLIKLYNSKEQSIIFVGSKNCTYCHSYQPILTKKVKELNKKVYYLEVTELKDGEAQKIMNLNEEFKKNFTLTPYTVAVKDKKIVNVLAGAYPEEEVEKFFRDIESK